MVALRSTLSFTAFTLLCLVMVTLNGRAGVFGFQSPMPIQSKSAATVETAVISSRKAFLASAAAAAVVAVGAPAAHADEYDDARAAKRAKAKESNGSVALAVPLIGGLALSLPFFLPNILRLLGVKNTKM